MSGLTLFVAPVDPRFEALYRSAADSYNQTPIAERNSGFDLFVDGSDVNPYSWGAMVGQGCRTLAVDADGKSRAYWLAPRSSICKTKWRLANSLGLIDATYRGVIKAALDRADPSAVVEDGARYCQLAAGDLTPWREIIVVAELPGPATLRLEGGFGSTGQ
jgi:dUTPase